MTSSWANELAIGNFVRFYTNSDELKWKFQNFYIAETVTHDSIDYTFLPFGFSGLSTSREGGLEPATLVFPNDDQGISRGYLSEALRGRALGSDTDETTVVTPYVAEVDVCILNPDDKTAAPNKLTTYTGQCTGGGWNDTSLQMQLSSLIDAATPDVPTRTLHQRLVGNLPFSSNVRLR